MTSLLFHEQLAQLPDNFFNTSQPLVVTRAPGRLDVMSGMADFSGGLCLQFPLAEASWCAFQPGATGKIEVHGTHSHNSWKSHQIISSQELAQWSLERVREQFARDASTHWIALIFGSLLNLRDRNYISAEQIENFGASLSLASNIPPCSGLASTASIITAATLAWQRAFNIDIDARDLLRLCARVFCNINIGDNARVDGSDLSAFAPILYGKESHLSQFAPQHSEILSLLTLPDDVVLYAFVCGKQHENARAIYHKARCATFMGRRILRDLIPHEMRAGDGEIYLANISVDVWRALRNSIPAKMSGSDFLNRYESHEDSRTQINPHDEYSIRLATEHPIYENARTERFVALLNAAQNNPASRESLLIAAGELMIQSHCSYDHRYALNSPETDLAVELCRQRIPSEGILGAKITANGGGGTIAILGDRRKNPDINELIHEIASEYETQTGQHPLLLTSSSPGALAWSNSAGSRVMNFDDSSTLF